MKFYCEPTVNMKPDKVIIMCGTNNLRKGQPEEIADKLLKLSMDLSERVGSIAVSELVVRTDSVDLERKRMKVNQILERKLEDLNMDFIKHDNIERHHLDKWGLHLNFRGTNILASNYMDYLKSV